MKYSTERVIKVEWIGSEFTVTLRMITLREKSALVTDAGRFDRHGYFEKSVPKIEGPEVNGRKLACGKDVLDTAGTDELFTKIMLELNGWELEDEDRKNS